MRYHVLATDYDGTLAHDGVVAEHTVERLERLKASGRLLVMVTGREIDDLLRVFPAIGAFDLVVAENGALIYDPATRSERPLAPPPDERFVQALRERGVEPLYVGRVIVATWEPHEAAVLDAIKTLGLELQVEFNKGSVMVLPAGMTKATGLRAALDSLGLSPHNAVGIGDAENDHAFLAVCEAAVAVSNALPALKERADVVTDGARGDGVAELVDRLLEDDLRSAEPALGRHAIPLGRRLDPNGASATGAAGDSGGAGGSGGEPADVTIQPYGRNLLVAGPSGSGKSTLVLGLLERLRGAGYQFCLIDPEGDFEAFDDVVVLGNTDRAPTTDEIFQILARPTASVVVNLLAVPLEDRPGFAQGLLPRVAELRAATGRPHWLIVDEAHHMLPESWQPAPQSLPHALESTAFITVHPDRLAPAVLAAVDTVVAVGGSAGETFESFAQGASRAGRSVNVPPAPIGAGEREAAALWAPGEDPVAFQILEPAAERNRHRRKYAVGELPAERSFFFRGPQGRLNLRAQNLQLFVQLADGVDDETWAFHLERGDYSRWMREMIKDERLAEAVADVERRGGDAAETRAAVRDEIERRYTAAA